MPERTAPDRIDDVLTVRGLTKRFGGFTAVDDLSLTVRRGQVFGFLGPNGAGKTTTIRIILGLVRPSAGQVTLLGTPRGRGYHRVVRRVGALIDYPALYGNLTGRQNLVAFGKLMGRVDHGRIDEVLELVNMTEAASRPARVYSQGMRQRLAIALALVRRPEMIFLDEPTNGLDPEGQDDILNLLKTLAAEHDITVFVSSHLLEEVERFCTHAAIIQRGRLLAEGPVDQLVRDRHSRMRLRVNDLQACRRLLDGLDWVSAVELDEADGALVVSAPPTKAPELSRRVVEAGLELHELARLKTSLRTFFMHLTGSSTDGDDGPGPA